MSGFIKPFHQSGYQATRLARKLSVIDKFVAYRASLSILNGDIANELEGYYLLLIDLKRKTLRHKFFDHENDIIATQHYLEEEKKAAKNNSTVVALVSSNSIKNLKEAYPNYFADSTVFLDLLNKVIHKHEITNPNWFKRFILRS